MATDVIKKIGATNTPVTMDYSTLQAWEDACPANLVTADQRWIGECYDQGTFTANVLISGATVDATRHIILRCAAGASFKDKAGVRTTALDYNTANGVSVEANAAYVIGSIVNFTVMEGLQARNTNTSDAPSFDVGANNIVRQCIGKSTRGFSTSSSSTVIENCLIINTGSFGSFRGQGAYYNCTGVGTTGRGMDSSYSNLKAVNCAVFGFATLFSGTLRAGTDYNATNLATAFGGGGTHNLNSLVYADQFESSTNDWRAKATGSLDGAGTPDAVHAPTDISGFTRSATAPTIGCWEVGSSVTNYTLTAAAGSYAQTGSTVALRAARTLSLSAGSYAQSGSAVALRVDRRLTLDAGTYASSGTAVDLRVTRRLALESGTYAQSGSAVTLTYGGAPTSTYTLTAESGTYATTGTAAGLSVARRLVVESGAYTATGSAVGLYTGWRLTVGSGTYAQTGTVVDVRADRRLLLGVGAYALTGTAATLTYSGEVIVPASPDYIVHVRADVTRIRVRPDPVIQVRPEES